MALMMHRSCSAFLSNSAPSPSPSSSRATHVSTIAVTTNCFPQAKLPLRPLGRRKILESIIFLGVFSPSLGDAAAGFEADGNVILDVGLENGRLRSCGGPAPCVSTSAFRSPSRFMPPWSYLGLQEDAFRALLKALTRMGAEIVKTEDGRYVYATLSTSKENTDHMEFLLVDKVVCYRSVSTKISLDPPFCWWPGCINGPSNRQRLEALRDDLGWIPLETDEDKLWTPIFLH